jgi:hypothetical protein
MHQAIPVLALALAFATYASGYSETKEIPLGARLLVGGVFLALIALVWWSMTCFKHRKCQKCLGEFMVAKDQHLIDAKPASFPGCKGQSGCLLVEQHLPGVGCKVIEVRK